MMDMVNKIASELPIGFTVHLCIENGSAYVHLFDARGVFVLPDSADNTLEEQLNNALKCALNY